MKTSHRLIWVAAAMAAAAVLATMASNARFGATRGAPPPALPTSAPVAGPLRIGVAVGLTGANSVVAPTVVQSSQLAVDEINAAGGILGRRVELEIADDASSADGARLAVALLLQKKVAAIIAMQTSAARTAALPAIEQAQLPYIYTSFYEGRACNPWMFVNGWVPEQQVVPVVAHLAQQKGAKKFFLVGNDYAFGRGMLDFARKLIEQGGGQVVGEDYLPIDGSDWAATVAKIRAAKPDALISATAGGEPNISLARQLKAAGLKLPYGNLAIDESTAKAMGDLATGMLVSASYFTSIETPENAAFLKRMLIRFGAALKAPNELSVPQYEAFHLYKAAAEQAGSTEPGKLIQALGGAVFNGPRGLVQMNRSRHAALSMQLGQVRSDGSIAILQTFPGTDPGTQCPGG